MYSRRSEEITRISQRLAGIHIPVFCVLESHMGDPVLSHWIGADGVVAGTALGRVSAYLFDNSAPRIAKSSTTVDAKDDGGSNSKLDQSSSKPSETAQESSTSAHGDDSKSDATLPSATNAAVGGVESPETSPANPDGTVAIHVAEDECDVDKGDDSCGCDSRKFPNLASLFGTVMNYIRCGKSGADPVRLDDVLPGRYTVFASFSDEPIRAVFIHRRQLYCLIGTSLISVYDVDKYALLNEYRLSLSRNAGYKQIAFAACKILVDCMRGSTILDPVAKRQTSSTHRVYPSNVLDFNGTEMMCYYRNVNKYFVQVLTLDRYVSKKVLFSISMPKSVFLVTHGRFWGSDKLVVVTDMLTISVYKYHEVTVPIAKRRSRVDIVALCGGFSDFLAVLMKDSTIKLLHGHTLETFFRIPLYPATFELGWPYTLINYGDIMSFTSDEGVYCLRLPSKVIAVASEWKDNGSSVDHDIHGET
ncbi:hypothetical protein, conserved [Babesia bigemina]|uniref:CNH domain-containing protein n=1 Tax=Babesia bigemina TaxID=5866 RepID=A0A061DDP5_BABBI|nr:hypothetical protein, conserved [Babesia bigemina]CDR97589.1 hypothetical protein, conserved [Babesia bigemina]|eukprot:XP_012769775.1 hypothetical protein, conserved [Babesia bigemina]